MALKMRYERAVKEDEEIEEENMVKEEFTVTNKVGEKRVWDVDCDV